MTLEKIIFLLKTTDTKIFLLKYKNKKQEIKQICITMDEVNYDIPQTQFFELLYQYGYIKQSASFLNTTYPHFFWHFNLSEKGEQFYKSKYPNV